MDGSDELEADMLEHGTHVGINELLQKYDEISKNHNFPTSESLGGLKGFYNFMSGSEFPAFQAQALRPVAIDFMFLS